MQSENMEKQRQEFEVELDQLAQADSETFQKAVVELFKGLLDSVKETIDWYCKDRDGLMEVLSKNRDLIKEDFDTAERNFQTILEELTDVQRVLYTLTIATAHKRRGSVDPEWRKWLEKELRVKPTDDLELLLQYTMDEQPEVVN